MLFGMELTQEDAHRFDALMDAYVASLSGVQSLVDPGWALQDFVVAHDGEMDWNLLP